MADALSEKTGQELNKALRNLIETINKGGLNGKSTGGETSKSQIENERKINSVLEKRLKDNKQYNDILKKINKNNDELLKKSTVNAKLEEQRSKMAKKQADLEKLRNIDITKFGVQQEKRHLKLLKTIEDEFKAESKKYYLLEKEIKLEKEKSKIEDQIAKDNAKQIAIEEKWNAKKVLIAEKVKSGSKATSEFLLTQGKAILNNLLDADSAISKLSANYALSKTESGYLKKNIGDIAGITQRIGVGFEDLTKMQTTYTDEIGRSVMLSKDGMISVAETSVALGLGVEATAKMAANMDLFGLGVKDSMNIFAEMTELSKKSGVSASVTAKKFENNLKLANTYNFKNGVEGVKKMTVEATKLGIKMESVAALADKVSSPEGAIETAAKLQVLGGSFAQMADPMTLLYQGINDMEGLTKTYSKMLDNVISVNNQTGEITENGYEKIRIKAAAEAAGISFDDMMTAARTKAKRSAITSQLDLNTNLKEEDKDLIASLATFEKGKGYTVNVRGVQKTITKLDKTDLNYIKPQEVKISEIAENTMGIREILENGLKALYSTISGALLNTINEIAGLLNRVFGWIAPKIKSGVDSTGNVLMGSSGDLKGAGVSGLGGIFRTLGSMKYNPSATKLAMSSKIAENSMLYGQKGLGFLGKKLPFIGSLLSGIGEYNESGSIARGIGSFGGSLGGGIAGGALAAALTAGVLSGVGTIPSLLIAAALAGGGAWAGGKAGASLFGNLDSIKDGIIAKDGRVTRIDNNDSVLAFKSGGQIDKNGILPSPSQKVFQGILQPEYSGRVSGDIGVGKIDVSGVITLNLTGGGKAELNANDLIHNQQFLKILARKLSAQINRDANGGKQSTILGPDAI